MNILHSGSPFAGNCSMYYGLGFKHAHARKRATTSIYATPPIWENLVEWCQPLMDAGQVDALFRMSVLLKEADAEYSLKLCQTAASHDHLSALHRLGEIYYKNNEGKLSSANYVKAAALGHALSQFKIGLACELNGNLEGAKEWYGRAAANGNQRAIEALKKGGTIPKKKETGFAASSGDDEEGKEEGAAATS